MEVERPRSHSFRETDSLGSTYADPSKPHMLPAHPVSDGETSSFTSEGHSTSIDSEDDDITFDDMPRRRSSSIHEHDSSSDSDRGPPVFDDFADGGSGDEPDFSRGRSRSRSRYGIEDASVLGITIVGSPPPPMSMLENRSTDSSTRSSPPARTGALREAEIMALRRVSTTCCLDLALIY